MISEIRTRAVEHLSAAFPDVDVISGPESVTRSTEFALAVHVRSASFDAHGSGVQGASVFGVVITLQIDAFYRGNANELEPTVDAQNKKIITSLLTSPAFHEGLEGVPELSIENSRREDADAYRIDSRIQLSLQTSEHFEPLIDDDLAQIDIRPSESFGAVSQNGEGDPDGPGTLIDLTKS